MMNTELRLHWRRVVHHKYQVRQYGVDAARLSPLRKDEVTLRVPEIWVETAVASGWMAATRFVRQGQGFAIAELRVFPREDGDRSVVDPGTWSAELLGSTASAPPGGLPIKNVLKKIRVYDHLGFLNRERRRIERKYGKSALLPPSRLAEIGLKPVSEERPRPRRQAGRSDEFYARLASDYVAAARRDLRRPLALIARTRRLPRNRVRDLIHEARVRGLLSPGVVGRVEGALTDRARKLLRAGQRRAKGGQLR